jgi:hypothetical protein
MARAKKRRMEEGWLTINEVGVFFQLPRRFVQTAIRTKVLRAVQAGQRAYIRREDAARAFGKRKVAA